jgi:ABC-type glycerol-3-phosphate transport system permease component
MSSIDWTNKKTIWALKRRERHSEWSRKPRSEQIILSIFFVLFLIYGASLIYPIVWTFYNSLKTGRVFNSDQFSIPWPAYWQNYSKAWSSTVRGVSLVQALWNSIWITLVSVSLSLISSSLTAYVVAKYKFKGSGWIYTVAVFIQIIPLVGGITGMYQWLWGTLGIADKPAILWVIWFGGYGFNFLMLYGAFKSVPWSFAESAFIDGASNFRVFWQIMVPMVKPVLASLFIVNCISTWQDYTTPYLYLPSYPTLSLAVYDLQAEASRIGIPLYFAIIIISIIPTLILFISFQNLIMDNTTTGGLKG